MKCEEAEVLIGAFHDGELGPVDSTRVIEHLENCEACRAKLDSLDALSSALKEVRSETAPQGLRNRLESQLATNAPRKQVPWAWMTAAAVLVLAAFFAGRLATGRPDLTSELVNSHVRSLIGNHLIDVVSSDRHTVKPWFAGKVDLTATPYDFKPQGFPLAGGRLDYLGGKPVPVFVYDHGKHVVNVYVLPSDMHIADAVVRGFSIVTWPDHDLEFVAISDAGAAELKQLEQLYRQQ